MWRGVRINADVGSGWKRGRWLTAAGRDRRDRAPGELEALRCRHTRAVVVVATRSRRRVHVRSRSGGVVTRRRIRDCAPMRLARLGAPVEHHRQRSDRQNEDGRSHESRRPNHGSIVPLLGFGLRLDCFRRDQRRRSDTLLPPMPLSEPPMMKALVGRAAVMSADHVLAQRMPDI